MDNNIFSSLISHQSEPKYQEGNPGILNIPSGQSNNQNYKPPTEEINGKRVKLNLDLTDFGDYDYLENYNSIETTYAKQGLKITDSFNPKTLEKVMFKIPFPEANVEGKIVNTANSLEDECAIMMLINKFKNSDDYFVQAKCYQKMLSYQEEERMVLGVEAGICSMNDDIEFRRNLNTPYTEEEVIYITCHLLEALSILKTNLIFHCDLKPENIFLFKKKGKYFYKIGDFGISFQCTSEIMSTSDVLGATKAFVCPEISSIFFSGGIIDHKRNFDFSKADLYSLGKTLEKILEGHDPSKYKRVIPIIKSMTSNENERKSLQVIKNEFQTINTNPKIPNERKIEEMVKKKLLNNYNKFLNIGNMNYLASSFFYTKSLFDVMEYSRIFEYFLLLQDFKSIKIWRKKVLKAFKKLFYTIFSEDVDKARSIYKINKKIFKASYCDEKIYGYQKKKNYKQIERSSNMKGELLEQALNDSDKLFGKSSLCSDFLKIQLNYYYDDLKNSHKLSKNQEARLINLGSNSRVFDANYDIKRIQVFQVISQFFGLANEPWASKFITDILTKNADVEQWLGSLNLKNYFKLQEVFSEGRNIKKSNKEFQDFLKYMLDGNVSFAVIDLFLKRIHH